MPQNEMSGPLDGLTVRDAVDRILAFNAKMHDVSATADIRERARSARDDGLKLVDYWKTDPQRKDAWRRLVQSIDHSDNVGRRTELQARLQAGEPVEVPGQYLGLMPRPKVNEAEPLEFLDPSAYTATLQNVEGTGQITINERAPDGTVVNSFPGFDPRNFTLGGVSGKEAEFQARAVMNVKPKGVSPFQDIPYANDLLNADGVGSGIADVAFGLPFMSFASRNSTDPERMAAHNAGLAPYRDTPNLHQDGRVISSSRVPGGMIDGIFGEAGFDLDEELGSLEANVTDPAVIRMADVLYGEKLTDESGDYVIDSAGQRVDLYQPLSAGATINTPEGPVTMSPDAIEEIVNSRSGGKLGGTIVGHFYHDDMVETPLGSMIVPKITGNPERDRALMNDPVFLRAFVNAEDGGQEFQTMFFAGVSGVAEFMLTMGMTKVAAGAAKGTLAAGIRTTAGQKMVNGFAKRYAGTGVAKVYSRVGAGMRKALTGGGGARATKVRAPMMNGDLAQIGEEVWYNTLNAAITGRESLLDGAISGVQEGISEFAFGSFARFSRRVASPLMRKMATKLSNVPGVGKIGKAVKNAEVGDASALLAAGLDDEFSQKVVGRALAKIQSKRGDISAAVANRFASAEVNGLLRSVKTQAMAEAAADSSLMGYMFGGYTDAIRSAQLDGKDFGSLDFWEKVEYMREGLASPGAMGGAVSFAFAQGGWSAVQMKQPPTANLTPEAELEIMNTIDYIVQQTVREPMQTDGEMAAGALALVEPAVNDWLEEAGALGEKEFSAMLSEELGQLRGHRDGLFREVGGELIADEVGRIYLKDGGPSYVRRQFQQLTGAELRHLRRETEGMSTNAGEEVNAMNVGRFLKEMIDAELADRNAAETALETQAASDATREEELQRAADFHDETAGEIPPSRSGPEDQVPEIPDADVPTYFRQAKQVRNVRGEVQTVHKMSNRNILVSERPVGDTIRYDVVGRSKFRPIAGSPKNGFDTLLEAQAFALKQTGVARSPLARLVAKRSVEPENRTAEYGRPDPNGDPERTDSELAKAISASIREKLRARSSLAEEKARSLRGDTDAGFDFVAPHRLTEPETAKTVEAQMDAMRAGRKPAVLITPGTDVPKLKRHERKVQIDEGRLIIPSKGSDRTIADLKANRITLAEVLGYGVQERGDTDQVVTAVDAMGRTVVDIQAEPTGETVMAAKKMAGEGGEVIVRTAADVVRERRRGQTPQDTVEKTEQLPFGAGLLTPKPETIIRNRRRIYEALRKIPGNGLKSEPELVDGWLRPKDTLSSKALNNRVRSAEKAAEKALAGRARIDASRKPRVVRRPKKKPEQAIGESGQAVGDTGISIDDFFDDPEAISGPDFSTGGDTEARVQGMLDTFGSIAENLTSGGVPMSDSMKSEVLEAWGTIRRALADVSNVPWVTKRSAPPAAIRKAMGLLKAASEMENKWWKASTMDESRQVDKDVRAAAKAAGDSVSAEMQNKQVPKNSGDAAPTQGALRAAGIKQLEAINAAEVANEQAVQGDVAEATQQAASRSRFWDKPEMAAAFRAGADMVTGQDSVGQKTAGTKTYEAAKFMITYAADKQRLRAFAAGMLVRLGLPNPKIKGGKGSGPGIRKIAAVANITGLTIDEVVLVQEQLRNDARAMVDVVDAKSTTLQRFLGNRAKNVRTRELLEAIALGAPQTETKSGRNTIMKPDRVREVLEKALRDELPKMAQEMQVGEAALEATIFADGGIVDRIAKGYEGIGSTVRDMRGRLIDTISTNFGLKKKASSFIQTEQMTVSDAADIVIEALSGRGQEMQTKAGIGRVVQDSVLAGREGPGLDDIATAGAEGFGVTIDAAQAVQIMREDASGELQGDLRVDDLNSWIKSIDDGRAALMQLYTLNAMTDAGIVKILADTEFDPQAPWEGFYRSTWAGKLMRRLVEGDPMLRGFFTRAVDMQGNPMFENEAAAIKAWEKAQADARNAVGAAQELATRWAARGDSEDGGRGTQEVVEAIFNAAASQGANRPIDPETLAILKRGDDVLSLQLARGAAQVEAAQERRTKQRVPEGHGLLNANGDGLRIGTLEMLNVWMHENMTEFAKLAKSELDLNDQDPMLLYAFMPINAALGFTIDSTTLDPVTGHGKFSLANLWDKAKRTKTYGKIADEFTRDGSWWSKRPKLSGAMGQLAANWAQHFGRGQRSGFLTKMVKGANWDYRRLSIAQQQKAARFLDKMGVVLDRVRQMKLSPAAQQVIIKAVRSGAHLRIGTPQEWEGIFGKGTAPMYEVMGEVVGLFNSMGRELVNEGVLEPEQFLESRYIPRLYDRGGFVHREAVEHLNAGRSPITGREKNSSEKLREEGAARALNLEEVLPIATIQEAKRIQEIGTMNDLVKSGNVLSKGEWDKLTPYERAFWTKAAEPAGGGRAFGQSQFEYEQEVLTEGERALLAEGEMTLEEKKAILDRRKYANPQQVRLQRRLERELEAMESGEAPDTPQKREMIDAMLNGYVSRNTMFELDMLLDQTDPEAQGVGFMQTGINIWRRQKTIQNPKHWSMNIYSSVITNWASGRVSGIDFIRSMLGGQGIYNQSGTELSLWWDWVQDGRPDTQEFTVEERDAIERVEEFSTALGSNTFGQLISEPVNMSEYLSDIANIGITETHIPAENASGLTQAVSKIITRRLPWQMRFDEKFSSLAGHPNPRMRAEALRALDGLYQMHEMFFKYAAALNAMKSTNMNMQQATEWGAVGTADYADRNPLIYKMTSRFNFAMTMEEQQATARGGQRIGVGPVAIQLRGRNAVQFRKAKRWAGKVLAGPFWNYHWQMVPTLLVEAPLSNPLTWTAAFASFSAMTQMMAGLDDGDHEDLMEALQGINDWGAVSVPDETLEEYKRQYGDAMVGGYFNSANSARDRLPLSKMVDFRRTMTQDLELLPGPDRGGRSTVVDISDGMLGPKLMRSVAREGVLRTMTKDLPVGLLSGMMLTTTRQVFDLIKGSNTDSRTDQFIKTVHNFAKETNSFLGGGLGGSLFSREAQNLIRTLSQDGRTLSESLRGIRRPLLERMTPAQKAKLAAVEFALPTRDVPRGTAELPGQGGTVEELADGPLGIFLDPTRPVGGTPDTQRFNRFKSRLTGQLADFAADAYIETLNSTSPDELDISTSGVLRGWLGLEQDLSIDTLDGSYVLRENPRTEIGKFLDAQAGGDISHEKAMIGATIQGLDKWATKVGDALEALMNKRRLDPALVRRISLALFKDVDEGRGVLEFIGQRVLKDKDTENIGIYYELYRDSGLAFKDYRDSSDTVLQRKLNEAFRETGAEDIEFPNTETRRKEVRRVLGPAAPDIAPNLFLQDLFPRRN